MNSLKVFFTLAVLVVSAFVMIYIAEGIYEARAASPMSLSIAPLPQAEEKPKEEPTSFIAPLKRVFKNAGESLRDKDEESAEQTQEKQDAVEVHHGLCVAAMTGDLEKTTALLNAGISADARDSFNIRAIARATLWGHYEVVEALLEKGASVNERERLGVTLLMLAANKGDKQLLELFLKYGADPDIKSDDGETALMIASKKGYEDIAAILRARGSQTTEVKAKQIPAKRNPFVLKRKADLSEVAPDVEAPSNMEVLEQMNLVETNEMESMNAAEGSANALDALTWAANVSKESVETIEAEMIEEILTRQDAVEMRKFTPEPEAATFSLPEHRQQVATKISEPIKPVVEQSRVEIPVLNDSFEMTLTEPELEVRESHDIHETEIAPSMSLTKRKTGRELMAARSAVQRIEIDEAAQEPVPVVRAQPRELIQIKADIESVAASQAQLIADKRNIDDVHLESQSYVNEESWVDPEMLERLPSEEELDTIFEEVRAIEVELSDWSKPELDAHREQGPVVFNPDDLMQAILAGALHRVRVVIDYGVDVNARGDLEMTPLMVAAQGGQIDVVSYLLKHGADVHAQNIVGQTALRLAILQENTDVIKMLKTHGAHE